MTATDKPREELGAQVGDALLHRSQCKVSIILGDPG
jgi:hypothetical protein